MIKHEPPLLATKLYLPRPRSDQVWRSRLLDQLNRGLALGHRLTVVAAPAGFGKTTLVSAWASVLPAGWRVAWLSLGPEDNDPILFWSYLLTAVAQETGVELDAIAQRLHAPESPEMPALVIEFMNALAAYAQDAAESPLLLVLDDYHLITSAAVHQALALLLERMPRGLHLALLSRHDPGLGAPGTGLPLAALRARGCVTELGAPDLRFTGEEAVAFFNTTMRLGLTPGEIVPLAAKTEGWAAGLQLAALSLQGQRNVAERLAAFSGSHRYVIDYLVEEVLDRQPPDTQDFLLRTSILRTLSGDLCDAVAGDTTPAGQRRLEALEAAQLFVVPLDDHRHWYRYHHLFAEFLQNRLRQQQPGDVADLHRRAAAWYAAAGHVREAVDHALEAEDFEMAVELVSAEATAHLVRGDVGTLRGWLEALPPSLLQQHAELGLIYALVNVYAMRLDVMGHWLDSVHETLPPLETAEDTASARLRWGQWYAVHAYWVRLRHGDHLTSLADAGQALALLPVPDVTALDKRAQATACKLCFWRDLARLNVGFAEAIGHGHTIAAATAFREVATGPCAALNPYGALAGLSSLGRMEIMLGRLHAAAATYRKGLALVERLNAESWHLTGYLVYGMAETAWLWNHRDDADQWLDRITRNTTQMDNVEIQLNVLTLRVSLACVSDDREALAAYQDAFHALSHRLAHPDLQAKAEALDVGVVLTQQRLGYAQDPGMVRRWLAEQDIAAFCSRAAQEPADIIRRWAIYRTLLRALITCERNAEALTLLDEMWHGLASPDAVYLRWHAVLLRALALTGLGRTPEALDTLNEILSELELASCVNLFLEEGAPMALLLTRLLARYPAESALAAYLTRLLDAYPPTAIISDPSTPTPAPESVPSNASSALVEPLTDREREILHYLGTELSTPEIAEALYVAASTVRSHVKSIYAKLDAHNRGEAVARAQMLGLM